MKAVYLKDKTGNKVVTVPYYPINSVVITSTNENPSTKFGGTWELVDKEFKEVYKNYEDTVFTKTSNISSCQLALTRSSKTIRITNLPFSFTACKTTSLSLFNSLLAYFNASPFSFTASSTTSLSLLDASLASSNA